METSRTKFGEEDITPTPRRRLIKADLTLRLSTDDDDQDMNFFSFSRDQRKVAQESDSSSSTSSGGGDVFGDEITQEDLPDGGSSEMKNTNSSKDQPKSSHRSSGVKRKFSFKSCKCRCFQLYYRREHQSCSFLEILLS